MRLLRPRRALLSVLLLAALPGLARAAAPDAEGTTPPPPSSVEVRAEPAARPLISASAWAAGLNGVGASARAGWPLLADGFLPGVRDSLAVELGAESMTAWEDLGHSAALTPAVALRWTLQPWDRVGLYATAGAGWTFAWWTVTWASGAYRRGVWLDAGAGALVRVVGPVHLRVEVALSGMRLGVAVPWP